MPTHSFYRDDSGAITVDWVVLTAAIVGIAIAVLLLITFGLNTSANTISETAASASDTAGSDQNSATTGGNSGPFSANTFDEYVAEYDGDNGAIYMAIAANAPTGYSYSGSFDNATNAPIYLGNGDGNVLYFAGHTTTFEEYDTNGDEAEWTYVWSPNNPSGGPTYSPPK